MSLQYSQVKQVQYLSQSHDSYHQHGFTLVELMITLVLGLIISAAALQVYYTSVVSNNIQQAGSDIVESGVFGVDILVERMQRANLGAVADSNHSGGYFLNHRTALGGVVLSAPTDMKVFGSKIGVAPHEIIVPNNLRGLNMGGKLINTNILSKNNASTLGDQITIQYQNYEENKTDCLGRNIPKDFYVIERYFVRTGGLACASAIYQYNHETAKINNGVDISRYMYKGKSISNDLAGDGQIIIPNVEYMRVLLGITNSKDFAYKPNSLEMSYIPIPATNQLATVFAEDLATGATRNRIVSLQIGLLIAAQHSTNSQKDIKNHQVLDKTINVSADGKVRNVYIGNILIRNARGNAS